MDDIQGPRIKVDRGQATGCKLILACMVLSVKSELVLPGTVASKRYPTIARAVGSQ